MKPIYDPLLGKMRSELTAGAGLDISGGTISTITPPDGVPYVAGEGVAIDGATIYSDLTGLDRIEVDGGTITYNPIKDIVTVSGSAVTLNPDTAYKIQATTQAVTLNANVPASGKWGLDGHAEIFVAGTGYVVTGSNVVLANALEPDAVNNCTLRFHDGLCIISVEDHVAGYIVVSATGTTTGSLPYGISSASQEYIAFDASLNGTTIDLSGSTANGEKHVVGNSYADTILAGTVDCGTSKFTVANLSLQDVVVNGGTMTLGDAYIPSGSTVAVSGGKLAVEKVTGDNGTIDLNGTNITANSSGSIISANDVQFTGASSFAIYGAAGTSERLGVDLHRCTFLSNHGGVRISASPSSCFIESCNFVRNSEISSNNGAALELNYGANKVTVSGCVFSGNSGQTTALFQFRSTAHATELKDCIFSGNHTSQAITCNFGGALVDVTGCTFAQGENIRHYSDGNNPSKITFNDSNLFAAKLVGGGTTCQVEIASGAILDLTGNTNATPINPGGGIIVSGGCTVINSAGASVSITGGTYTQINNDGTTE